MFEFSAPNFAIVVLLKLLITSHVTAIDTTCSEQVQNCPGQKICLGRKMFDGSVQYGCYQDSNSIDCTGDDGCLGLCMPVQVPCFEEPTSSQPPHGGNIFPRFTVPGFHDDSDQTASHGLPDPVDNDYTWKNSDATEIVKWTTEVDSDGNGEDEVETDSSSSSIILDSLAILIILSLVMDL